MKSRGLALESIKQPEKVKVLILVQNKTSLKEFYFIKNYANLIKIDLSYNKLAAFPAGFNFTAFNKLRTLFLHYNKFSGLKNILPVTHSPNLLYLTLFGNPLEEAKARHFIINEIPSLMLLDDKVVRIQQRYPEVSFNETAFQAVNFPLIPETTGDSSEMYLENVIKQLHIVRSYYLLANPIVKIQRWWRHRCHLQHRFQKMPEVEHITLKNFRKTKGETKVWDRVITEKYQILDSPETKVLSLFTSNAQFWSWFRQSFIKQKIYLSRHYCLANNIKFQQIKHFVTLRTFLNVNAKKIASKRHLNFFLCYHNSIVLKKPKGKTKRYNIAEDYKIIYKKLLLTQSPRLQSTLKKRQQILDRQCQNHKWYVKPTLSETDLFKIIKNQYQRYIRNQIRGAQNQPFPILIQKLNQRAMASVTIQRHWKGYRVRRYVNVYRIIKQTSAARKIQKWLRSLRFVHRYKFLLLSQQYLRRQKNSKEIILQAPQLKAIEEYCTHREHFGRLLVIQFQNNTFSIQRRNGYMQHIEKEPIITFHSERKPYLHYFNLNFQIAAQPQRQKISETIIRSNILQILFKGVEQIHQSTDLKGNKTIKFTYRSTQQTLNRKFILALKTYRMPNHQFITSAPLNTTTPIVNLIAEFNSHWLVSLSQKHEKEQSIASSQKALSLNKSLDRQLHQNPKDILLQGDTYYFKIKLYIVATDFSCTLKARSPNYASPPLQTDDLNFHSLNPSSKKLSKSKSPSNRYQNDLPRPQRPAKISRNIMSLDNLESISPSRKQSQNFPKIMNTDQSYSYLTSINHEPSQTNILPIDRRRASEQKYQELTINKQNKIKEIKHSHRQKIRVAFCRKQSQIINLRKSIKDQKEQVAKSISCAREELQSENAKKHNEIKNHLKHISSTFESQFLKKGIQSIRRNLRDYEKTRSHRQTNKSHKKTNNNRLELYETDIKQFSIRFTEEDYESIKHNYDSSSAQKSKGLRNPRDKPKKEMSTETFKEIQMSTETFKGIISISHADSSAKNEELQQDLKKIEAPDNLQENRKLKKKRFVHSVFPEEFYPIRQSGQIQFELPRINKK